VNYSLTEIKLQVCPTSFHGTCQWLKFPLNGLRAQSRVSAVVGYEIYEKKSRIHLDRLQNKYTNYKGIKYNTNFGQITGIQEELATTCK
jgi:hypothetical protein